MRHAGIIGRFWSGQKENGNGISAQLSAEKLTYMAPRWQKQRRIPPTLINKYFKVFDFGKKIEKKQKVTDEKERDEDREYIF